MALSSATAIERHTLAFLDRTLPKAEWTHEGHFAAALWLARHRPDLATPEAMRPLIMTYNEAVGGENTDTGGYHHTITCASIRAAQACLAKAGTDASLEEVLAGLMASPLGKSDWLLAHWNRDTLFSVEARRGWVEPDLEPLSF